MADTKTMASATPPYTYEELRKLWADVGEGHPTREELTCSKCRSTTTCVLAWYSYNTNGACLVTDGELSLRALEREST